MVPASSVRSGSIAHNRPVPSLGSVLTHHASLGRPPCQDGKYGQRHQAQLKHSVLDKIENPSVRRLAPVFFVPLPHVPLPLVELSQDAQPFNLVESRERCQLQERVYASLEEAHV